MLDQRMLRSRLAADRVRFVGEPVAVVISDTAAAGADAVDLVYVDYEPLHAVVTVEESVTDETLLFPDAGTNVVFAGPSQAGDDFFDGCEVTVDLTFNNQRIAPCPLEVRATAARWDHGDDGTLRLTQWSTTQGAHGTRDTLAEATGVDPAQVRVICPDVGGGFGAKNGGYPEDIVVALVARKLDRPVRWVETRSESMLGLVHGRGCVFTATIGGDRDGNVKAYRVHSLQDGGAYPEVGAVLPFITAMMASGVYDIPKVDFSFTSVMTNTVPMGAYRGAGRPEAAAAIERMMEVFAVEIGMDAGRGPAEELHRTGVVPVHDRDRDTRWTPASTSRRSRRCSPPSTTTICVPIRNAVATDPDETRLLGLGWSAYVEIANPIVNGEFGSFELQPDGSVVVLTGSSSHGQGHHTAFAQLASDITGIPMDRIEVRHGDTDEVARGGGTGGSKSLQVGGSAVWQASEAAVAQAKEIAADLLEANPADVVLDVDSGQFSVAGTPAVSTSWVDIAEFVQQDGGEPLRTEADFQPVGATFPFGVHLSVVEVDRDTGEVTVLRHVACDDAGTLVNPLIVDGQAHGGIASGIAQALDGGVRLRRRRQPEDRELRRLRAGVGGRTAVVRADRAGDADAAQPDRGEGDR